MANFNRKIASNTHHKEKVILSEVLCLKFRCRVEKHCKGKGNLHMNFGRSTDKRFDMESTMWSFIQHNRSGPFLAGQKREFGIHYENNVCISPDRSFQNPNFVNNLPHIENCNSVMGNCQNDIKNKVVDQASTRNNCLKNSSRSIIDTLKKNHMDIVRDTAPDFKVSDNKIEHENCRRKAQIKSPKKSNHRQFICDMMEIDVGQDVDMNASNTNLYPKEQTMLNLADFIVHIPCESSDTVSEASDNEDDFVVFETGTSDEESDDEIQLPQQRFLRERNLSTNSEDSFVVFETGSDDELEISEEEESDDEDDLEVEDEFDSSSPVIPCKRVRFAAKEDLCQVHPMIQWSFAYRKARKGPWEEYARDRSRFKKRVGDVEKALAPIFDCRHRERMYKERFQHKSTD